MLRISVINKNQRQQYLHESGELSLGRTAHGTGESILINDIHVSREQLRIEEIAGDQMRLDCVGRSPISLQNGEAVTQGQSLVVALPSRLTVGETIIEVESSTGDSGSEDDATTMIRRGNTSRAIVTLEYVSNFYPYPLAYGYRLLRSITNPAELYKEQLRLAENILAYIASVSLALLDDEQRQYLNQKFQQSALQCWRGGISAGHWIDLAIHAAEQLEQRSSAPFFRALVNLKLNKDKTGFGGILRNLIKAKNDYKHDRGPSTESEYRESSEDVAEQLRLVHESLSFFKSHSILLVQDINPHRRGQQADVVFLKCMGDHPGFETEEKVASPLLRKGDLYIESTGEELMSLYPFVHATMCEQCKTREFYFLDRLDEAKNGADRGMVACLKSFERGHVKHDREIGQEMQELLGGS